MRDNPVLRVCAKVLFAPIIIYGLYVQFHGDFGPGGGFQAGVIVAAAFILYAIVFGLKAAKAVAPESVVLGCGAVGVIIFSGVGVVNMLGGGNYLEYDTLAENIATAQHTGIILVELGVGVAVTSVMLGLYYLFAGYKTDD